MASGASAWWRDRIRAGIEETSVEVNKFWDEIASSSGAIAFFLGADLALEGSSLATVGTWMTSSGATLDVLQGRTN